MDYNYAKYRAGRFRVFAFLFGSFLVQTFKTTKCKAICILLRHVLDPDLDIWTVWGSFAAPSVAIACVPFHGECPRLVQRSSYCGGRIMSSRDGSTRQPLMQSTRACSPAVRQSLVRGRREAPPGTVTARSYVAAETARRRRKSNE